MCHTPATPDRRLWICNKQLSPTPYFAITPGLALFHFSLSLPFLSTILDVLPRLLLERPKQKLPLSSPPSDSHPDIFPYRALPRRHQRRHGWYIWNHCRFPEEQIDRDTAGASCGGRGFVWYENWKWRYDVEAFSFRRSILLIPFLVSFRWLWTGIPGCDCLPSIRKQDYACATPSRQLRAQGRNRCYSCLDPQVLYPGAVAGSAAVNNSCDMRTTTSS